VLVAQKMQAKKTARITETTTNGEVMFMVKAPCK
jgi:hypothetical protein